ncbi:dTMP kinase [Nematocida sp. AWRm80]|nr:dTMP kinase [Nematocida sp. AWRm80]
MSASNREDTPLETKPLFIVVEGIDRSGKSTLVNGLCDELKRLGLNIKKIRYPNRNNLTGELINQVLTGTKKLSNEAMHLLFSANRWEDAAQIESYYKEKNTVIICDRYILSGAAYSIANGLSPSFAFSSDEGNILPNLTLFIDVTPGEASYRQGYGNEIYEKKEFQEKVYKAMKNNLQRYPHIILPSTTVHNLLTLAVNYTLDLIKEQN